MPRKLMNIFAFIFCYTLIFIRWSNIPIDDTNTQARVGVYGDAFSSRNVHSAAMWFQDMGYRKTVGLPVFNYTGNFNQSDVEVYTHYPPLPDMIGGLYARMFDTKNARALAICQIILSIFFFFFLLKALRKLIPDDRSAYISWILLVTSCYFICWADDLHQHLYTEFLKWIYIYVLYRYFTDTRKKWMLPVLCLVFFVQSWITFESIPFLAITTIGFFVIFRKKVISADCFLLLLMPVVGVCLHLYQNYLYFGDWPAVFADLKSAFLKRTTGTGELSNELGRAVQPGDFLRMWFYELWFRLGRMFTLPAFSFIIFSSIALRKLYKQHRVHFKMAIVFFLAGIAWIFVMPQHAIIHTFTVKHLGVFVGFTLGYSLVMYINWLKQYFKSAPFYWQAANVLLMLYTIAGFAYNQGYYVYLKFSLLYPRLGTDAHLW
jgi:hypothetical protein